MSGRQPVTLGDMLAQARAHLHRVLSDDPLASPELDARLLVARACEVADHVPLIEAGKMLSQQQVETCSALIARRARGEPVARIFSEKEFWGLLFSLNDATLIPRPQTEGIVEIVLKWVMDQNLKHTPLTIVDIGTGSGAILIALLTELPFAQGFATDISLSALQMAIANARRHRVNDRFQAVCCDYGNALKGPFHIILSNPPYIRIEEKALLPCEVREHDPSCALFGGEDGLDAYRMILPWCADNLKRGGLGVVEHGFEQADVVRTIGKSCGFNHTTCVFDMAKLPRFGVFGEKTNEKR